MATPALRTGRFQSWAWDDFTPWFDEEWEPGKHLALIGPTGEGKTTFAVPILSLRKYVIALDPKGEDETLSKSGFKRITTWPPSNKIRDEIAEGKPARLLVGGKTRTRQERERLVELMAQTIEGVRGEGHWTLYADEFQLLADRRMMGLDKPIEELLISARSNGTSVVTTFQAPAWVPKASTRQAWSIVMFRTKSRDMIQTVAEAAGRPWHDIADAMDQLCSSRAWKYTVLVLPQDIDEPMILTRAPKL